VAHACNTSYSGGRDQVDLGSKPALGMVFLRQHHVLKKKKKKTQKRAGEVTQVVTVPTLQM
jgi:hypothetical protein